MKGLYPKIMLLVGGVFVVIMVAIVAFAYVSGSRQIEQEWLARAETLNRMAFEALYASLAHGGGQEGNRQVTAGLQEIGALTKVRVVKGDPVIRQFGAEVDELPLDDLERRALDLGADDYLTKPFGVEEMLARVRATLRRTTQVRVIPRPPLVAEDLEIDFAARRVTVRGREARFTPTEYGLLAHLAINAGRVLTHQALLRAVWGPEYGGETEYLWAYIWRLRCKIEPDPSDPCHILTWPGVGYSFVAPP